MPSESVDGVLDEVSALVFASSMNTAAGVVQSESLYTMNFAPLIGAPVMSTFLTSRASGRI